jgi:hypothetical protein
MSIIADHSCGAPSMSLHTVLSMREAGRLQWLGSLSLFAHEVGLLASVLPNALWIHKDISPMASCLLRVPAVCYSQRRYGPAYQQIDGHQRSRELDRSSGVSISFIRVSRTRVEKPSICCNLNDKDAHRQSPWEFRPVVFALSRMHLLGP